MRQYVEVEGLTADVVDNAAVAIMTVCDTLPTGREKMRVVGSIILSVLEFQDDLEKRRVVTIPAERIAPSFDLRRRVLERDEMRCLACGTEEGLQVDHVVPVALGGLTTEDNLQTLCGPCNRRKGAAVVRYVSDECGVTPK